LLFNDIRPKLLQGRLVPVDRVQVMSVRAYGRMKDTGAQARYRTVMLGAILADLLGVGALRLIRP
jgi:hypothetical protein